MPATIDADISAAASEAEFDSWLLNHWSLGRRLSNPNLQNDIFIVDEKVADGVITYKLPLNDFLAINKKSATHGNGFSESKCTKNVHQDKENPYIIRYEACSREDADDWSSETCDLRQHLKMKSGILFGGDAAPAVQIKKAKSDAEVSDASAWDTYEMSAEEARAIAVDEEEEQQLENGETVQTAAHEFHPEHKLVKPTDEVQSFPAGPPEGQLVANGIFSDGAKLGKLVNFIIDGPPHPGRKMTRKDAKGHVYFGCEKHEHLKDGSYRSICT